MDKNKKLKEILYNIQENKLFIRNYNKTIEGFFTLLLIIYIAFTVFSFSYFLYYMVNYAKHAFLLLKYNAIFLLFFIACVYIINSLVWHSYICIGDSFTWNEIINLKNSNNQERNTTYPSKNVFSEVYSYIKWLLIFEIIVMIVLFILEYKYSDIITIFLFYVGFFFVGGQIIYFNSLKSTINILKYYLIGKIGKIQDFWALNSGISFLSKLSLILCSIFLYCFMFLLGHTKHKYGIYTNIVLFLYIIWSMLIYIVLNIYAGYLCSVYKVKNSDTKKISWNLIKNVFVGIFTKMNRIVGISFIYAAIVSKHIFMTLVNYISKNKNTSQKRFGRMLNSQKRYDQIEIEISNYIQLGTFYTRDKDIIDNFMSRYWIVTKPMFIGRQLFGFSCLAVFPILILLVKIFNENRNYLPFFQDSKIFFISFIFLSFLCIFMMYAGFRSFLNVSFRTIFILKDGHLEDTEKITEKIFNDIVNELYSLLFSMSLEDRMDKEETALKIYDTQLIQTLDAL